MLFREEDAPHLKKWIVKRLENTSDADADVLADYVLALLRHDGDVNDVRKLCEEEIPDFLKEDSSVFVNDVFEAIAYRSYLPGAPPPPPKPATGAGAGAGTGAGAAAGGAPAAAAIAPAQPPGSLYYNDALSNLAAPGYRPPFQNGSRKRYHDWDNPNAQNGGDAGFGERAAKQPRRGGGVGRGGSRSDDVNDFRASAPAFSPYSLAGPLQPPGAPAPSTVGYFDPNKGPMDAMFGMSLAAGHPMPGLAPPDRNQPSPRRRKKCRDWEKKGYCQRGSNCMFEHSNDPVYPPMAIPSFAGMQPAPQPSTIEEYDPANALMPDLFAASHALQGHAAGPAVGQHPRPRGGKHPNRPRRNERAPFSAEGPVFDRTKSTIVVENIPEESFSEEHVRDFFSQFGKIVEVSMQPYKRLAIVKFDRWHSANAAYQSPKVIFDNRFVKVFWYKDDNSTLPGTSSMTGGVTGAKKTKHLADGSVSADGRRAGPPASDIDVQEFTKQQEEKQRAFEEKTKKREELERQRQELERRQQELIAKQMEEKAKLEAKLAQHNGAQPGDADGETKPSKPVSKTEALRAQLAALEAEARQMGLDPDAMVEAPAPWPARGGSYGYGRGRGGWRGASSSPYTPRGSVRGGYRGRANVHAAYAAYSLDNRPKKVVLTGVDFSVSEKDETLRQYLFGVGEFTDIHTSSTSTEITFKDRKTAEKFFNSVLLNNKEIPGLEGSPVEVAWGQANGSSGSAPTTPGASTPTANSNNTTGTPGRARATVTTSSTSKGTTAGTGGTTTTTTPGASADRQLKKHGATNNNNNNNNKHNNNTNNINNDSDGNHGHNDDEEGGDDAGAGSSSSDKDMHILLDRPPADQNEMDYEVADENQWGY